MFDIGGGELLVIGIVALVVIGPKELPGLLRTAGNAMGKVRRMAAEFRGQFDEAMREAELDEAKKAFTDVNDAARSATSTFNPLETIRNEIKAVKDEIKGAPAAETTPAATVPEPKIEPLAPPPPVNLVAETPPAPAVEEPEPKPKRSRKKASEETPGSAA
ncbi:MAG: twin-arginine translocase subunit TatB [Methylocystis sp.]|nr:twin-arginine translocase subunit TatB [Methylocystis sp.]MCA3584035.1 twin-arginine translocase subunit TatB [Methylocystis sp.]MCA3586679.1 twin-arginine translocase subunit TatB [Methylocystis sp.]MCA3591649.1 twin-arginine translocase subunit TatB [Methylocystis sp.]